MTVIDLNTPEGQALLKRLMDANKTPCGCGQGTGCSGEQRLSSRRYKELLKKATDGLTFKGPLNGGASTEISIPAYGYGWKMSYFTAAITMAAAGEASDISVQVTADGEVYHEWRGDIYRDVMCCEILRRLVDECFGYETVVKLIVKHNGNPGDPPLQRLSFNFGRLYDRTADGKPNPLWGWCPDQSVCSPTEWSNAQVRACEMLRAPTGIPGSGNGGQLVLSPQALALLAAQ